MAKEAQGKRLRITAPDVLKRDDALSRLTNPGYLKRSRKPILDSSDAIRDLTRITCYVGKGVLMLSKFSRQLIRWTLRQSTYIGLNCRFETSLRGL